MKNVSYEDSKLRSFQLWERVIQMISTDDLGWPTASIIWWPV